MLHLIRTIYCLCMAVILAIPTVLFASNNINIPILCYHNLNPVVPGSMNMTPQRFEEQIKWIKQNGFTVIPLKEAVEYLQGTRASLPEKSVVITADDGWKSVYTYMLPIVRKYKIPVTLFIYPQTISNGKNAMTWDQLKELQQTGLFDIQGHTYSHPNFKRTKKKLSRPAYEKFVKNELVSSKKILEEKLGTKITFLAWPFGIYDDYLEQEAKNADYTMAFSIDAKTANKTYKSMAQPRFMIIESQTMKTYAAILKGATAKPRMASTTPATPDPHPETSQTR
ncbi:Poly-beta-1,6-N-acetyl-D-glucosamine N-deacetylase [Aquicella siphonis]|uniref:Poly-beta-1,6-N-acetyl-D-glucosamine N-deacetylase n=1 Tax=Aquicella siphonis TaxID=254247 RepID=A0A5E4PFZ1_9COXI|nr:polysaccharide deacetylase family protein [Aquicella siphonis]VVC75452.1 Poly-beta-1,6-N-acetyl-D-glucosamine N-deacetylase [Aquicella siphonis]